MSYTCRTELCECDQRPVYTCKAGKEVPRSLFSRGKGGGAHKHRGQMQRVLVAIHIIFKGDRRQDAIYVS